ncbi:cytochrome P450 [Streptomyces sp. NPDC059161]|uniref:cytochrome P450 n=1 Tax=Streptomyces sp. NPDC059161 TaxID=3346749 RepID=UPI0036B7A6D0
MSANDIAGGAVREEVNAEFYAWLRRMRETEPVGFDATTGLWSVFGHAEAVQIMAGPEVYGNDLSEITPPQEDYDVFFKGNIAGMDEPRHRKFRQLVSKVFSARYIAGLEEKLTAIATELLDRIGSRKRFDLAKEFATPFPVTVIADILGAPREDGPRLAKWASTVHAGEDTGVDGLAQAAEGIRLLNAYLFDLIEQRRAKPEDDLISLLIGAELEGRRLADDEIVGFVGVLLMGGISTTAALITNIVLTFDRFPEQWAEVRADRALIPQAIEEVVRLHPSFSQFLRMTRSETELGGRLIPAHSMVKVWVTSANRDATVFPDAERFDLHREGPRHIGFGQGIHYCIGAPLARLEGRIAFDLLLDRYPEYRILHEAGVGLLDTADMIGASRLPVAVTRA